MLDDFFKWFYRISSVIGLFILYVILTSPDSMEKEGWTKLKKDKYHKENIIIFKDDNLWYYSIDGKIHILGSKIYLNKIPNGVTKEI